MYRAGKMSSSFLFLVSCVVLLGGFTDARPIHVNLRETNGIYNDHVSVMLGVKEVTNSSALLDWNVPDDNLVLNFKISCQGYSKNSQLNFGEAERTNDHSFEHTVPRDVHHFQLQNLKPDYNYSCTLMATEFDEELLQDRNKLLIAPIHFTTPSISTDDSKSAPMLDFNNLKEKYGEKSAYIILGGGVPLCIVVIAAVVGACVLCRKCNTYRERKNNTHRRVNEDKLNRRLKGVVYNPLAMEYTTKWHQPNTVGSPPTKSKFTDRNGHQSGQGLRKTGLDKGVPYGKLSLNDLVNRVEQARKQSPFADTFKNNDPVKIRTGTPPFLSYSSLSTSISSLEFSDEDTIRIKPVIPNMKLSTPVFKQPRKVKKIPRKLSNRESKPAVSKKLTPRPCKSRSCNSRPFTKAVLVQPKVELESDSGSSIDIFVAPQFPRCEGTVQT